MASVPAADAGAATPSARAATAVRVARRERRFILRVSPGWVAVRPGPSGLGFHLQFDAAPPTDWPVATVCGEGRVGHASGGPATRPETDDAGARAGPARSGDAATVPADRADGNAVLGVE